MSLLAFEQVQNQTALPCWIDGAGGIATTMFTTDLAMERRPNMLASPRVCRKDGKMNSNRKDKFLNSVKCAASDMNTLILFVCFFFSFSLSFFCYLRRV